MFSDWLREARILCTIIENHLQDEGKREKGRPKMHSLCRHREHIGVVSYKEAIERKEPNGKSSTNIVALPDVKIFVLPTTKKWKWNKLIA